MENKRKISGLGIQIVLSIICIALGALLLLFSEVNATTLSAVFCISLIVAGAASLFIYFWGEGYRRVSDYSFAVGVLLAILGVCGLVRIEYVAASFYIYTGIVSLVLGVMMLQSAVSLTVMKNPLYIMQFILSGIVIICAVLIVDDFRTLLDAAPAFPQITLLASGILSLSGLAVTAYTARREAKLAEKAKEEAKEDEDSY